MVTRTNKPIEADHLLILRRIEELIRAIARATLSERLAEIMQDTDHRLLYEQAGYLSVKELAKRTGFSVGKISGLWGKWEQVGLLVKEGKQYRRVL